MNYLISMFIDNELELREKVEFVKAVRRDDEFYEESIALLDQEQMLQSDMDAIGPALQAAPSLRFEKKRKWFRLPDLPTIRPFAFMSSAGAMAVVVALLVVGVFASQRNAVPPYRFVIYEPDVSTVEILGSFTDWERLPMKKVGAGYWEIELNIPKGEHRYSFILDKEQRITDPSVFAKESDDFGGENSILFTSV